ncbi:unnamed protein product [Polarella glacialis]|uniref:Nucleotide-diphospho-sugar transferase domain-containing protein n=1 Tax=Polarella glacialis TaxID=89957 RepID=A0A813JQF8_POLGL|nr:unnamed protein product [Polarella glacialis]
MDYANYTALENQKYAQRWGYGFHVFDHPIDQTRVPHWSKLYALQMFLADYDFLFWIDADAVFFDHSRRLEEVFDLSGQPDANIWAQDIWPDYPSLAREELVDTGTFLLRNSDWTRQFLIELYYFPQCEQYLNWTEQYCFTLAYKADLMCLSERLVILPTPHINHHLIPPPEEPHGLFILHLAGRSSKARHRHFRQLHEGRLEVFKQAEYDDFWRFRKLFEEHRFGGVASLQVCIFGLGERHQRFLDALMFHFPYMAGFSIIQQGAAGLWSQIRASEIIGERFGSRMALIDIQEYMAGKTREGEDFIKGFFCDFMVLGVESFRHLPKVEVLGPLIRSGLEAFHGASRLGFSYSSLKDSFFLWSYDGCDGGQGAETAAATGALLEATPGQVLDKDDEDGRDLAAACQLLWETRLLADEALMVPVDTTQSSREQAFIACEGATCSSAAKAVTWKQQEPELWGVKASGHVALGRVPRQAFQTTPTP